MGYNMKGNHSISTDWQTQSQYFPYFQLFFVLIKNVKKGVISKPGAKLHTESEIGIKRRCSLLFLLFFAVLANLHFKPVSDNRIKEAGGDYADEWGG